MSLDKPLSDRELNQLDEWLLDIAPDDDDDAIMGISELDGFLTAVLSGPRCIMPSEWLPMLWVDGIPTGVPQQKMERMLNLLMRHANSISHNLATNPDDLALILDSNHDANDNEILVAEDWCCGYLRGVKLAAWPALQDATAKEKAALKNITLHGDIDGSDFAQMTLEQHQQSVMEIGDAAATLFRYWLPRRDNTAPTMSTPFTLPTPPKKVGRNEPCPCGSGKKFKQCCLH